ncbi:putative zinc finger C-x8-C-x5-C-x3-H type [Plasmodium gaboni]|uniref:Putative zinc finger C-x8-C-x5-C-x3-H type n=1 Tax=Plasmodium gaboni TaxID=647221 RepID=A0A151LKL9_9APIC|nr:putative zinc finger C-x8-C-x5-C-x3-H type [Plasmodium gaboni]KYN99462.1 putative zinc finger C-x8-C-x5-C-x3-H type [Plasmodium gaboni]
MNITSDIKYQFSKTKICKHFLEQKCLNTHNCNYAHVLGELRPLPNLMNTKLCRSYKKNIPCINPNCKYAHKVENLQPTTDLSTYKTSLCYFWKRKKCMNEEKCRFAHGIEEIRPLKLRPQKEVYIKEEKINDHNNNINCNSNMDELQNDNKKNIFNQEDLNNLLSHLLLIQNWSPEIKKNNDKNEEQQIYTNEKIVSDTSLSSNMLIQNSKEHNKEYINLSIYNKLCDENLNANYNKQLDDYIKYNSLKINDNNNIERSTTNTIKQDQYCNLFSSNDTFCDSNEDNYNDTHVAKDQDFYKDEYINIYNHINDPIFSHISSEQPMNDEDCFDELYKSIKEEITKKYENIYIY